DHRTVARRGPDGPAERRDEPGSRYPRKVAKGMMRQRPKWCDARWRPVVLGIGAILLLAGAAHTATKPPAIDREKAGSRIVDRMLATYRTLRSLDQASTSAFETAMGREKNRSTASSRLVYRRPNRFRYEESASQESIIVACDGKQLWIYS